MSTTIHVIDYGAGNIKSVVNAVIFLGHKVEYIRSKDDFARADRIIFPGVGAFGTVMDAISPIKAELMNFISSGKPLLGICVGLQALFEASDESPGVQGLGLFKGTVKRFLTEERKPIPHMGWNSCISAQTNIIHPHSEYYFVHSYAVPFTSELKDVTLSKTRYGNDLFVSSVLHKNVFATQFHPEKSGKFGLKLLKAFIEATPTLQRMDFNIDAPLLSEGLTKRLITCLDVRANDSGELVVTKGDQYDVREKSSNEVRNLGDPAKMATVYYEAGIDEICFLNITSFRNSPLKDFPMLKLLQETSKSVFVPLTIGGGIRDFVEPDGTVRSALDVVSEYFKSGADKVSIGTDAVIAVEDYFQNKCSKTGNSSIERISLVYGSQAVVVSIDPKRVYVRNPNETNHTCSKALTPGPNGEEYCWYQCTTKGGRQVHNIDVVQLAIACERLGAGEFLVNSMDQDGTNSGFDTVLLNMVKENVNVPVIASSGAGCPQHIVDVFRNTHVDAALAAGIFHRDEVTVSEVKTVLVEAGIRCRNN